ncbi:hypothetical protein RN01_08450 [Cupriavidus sp. SHE]|nr:hypothetical protein RN01_08450 [Cupriavidus sp. SHE]
MVAPGVGERTARAGKQNTGRSVDRFTIADKTNYPAVDTRILRAALNVNESVEKLDSLVTGFRLL